MIKQKPKGYWKDFANLERELRAFTEAHGTLERMPTDGELLKGMHLPLTGEIGKPEDAMFDRK